MLATTKEIVRRPDRVTGGITPEEKVRLDEHANKWIKVAFRTEPADREKLTSAIKDLYAAAGLKEPRIVIVPSPLVMAIAGGFAAAIWQVRSRDAATYDATDAATRDATDAATYDATAAATYDATRAATRDATADATYDATADATRAATRAATYDAVTSELPPGWAIALAKQISKDNKFLFDVMIGSAKRWWNMRQPGNMYVPWVCYLAAFRDVLGLRLKVYEKFDAWERCAMEGSYRIMHPEFCMVSDFPEILKVDDRNRPHCEDGPSHRWRDGWELYHWHGVRLTDKKWIINNPEQITIQKIDEERNQEIKRVMLERFGFARYLQESGATLLNEDECGKFFSKSIPGDEDLRMVEVINSTAEPDGTFKHYMLRVPPHINTAREACAWGFGLTEEQYVLEAQS